MLHENPVLPRSQIGAALNKPCSSNPPSNPLAKVLGSSGLANQIEMIKITPTTMGREEMAWIWTALKADYRPHFRLRRFGGPARVSLGKFFALAGVEPNISVTGWIDRAGLPDSTSRRRSPLLYLAIR